jgi:hypothetical protein
MDRSGTTRDERHLVQGAKKTTGPVLVPAGWSGRSVPTRCHHRRDTRPTIKRLK